MKEIFKTIVGSQAYGTATPQSDVDHKGVYIQDQYEILGFKYKPQIEVSKDECYFEVRRFLELLQSANPTMLELLYSPADCIVRKSPEFDLILNHKEKFLTKKCKNSFVGYAVQQIQKAEGLDKKMNWEKEKIEKKDILEFCYYYDNGKTFPLKHLKRGIYFKEENCGLIHLNHFGGYCFALYYDKTGLPGFKGLFNKDRNNVILSEVPKDLKPVRIIHFNKDDYRKHLDDLKSYNEWIKNRNEARYVDIAEHNQKIDGKNMLHCVRLIETAKEIALERTINVKRENADYLLSIRKGQVDLKTLIEKAKQDLKEVDILFDKCFLPEDVDPEFVHELLIEVRKYSAS